MHLEPSDWLGEGEPINLTRSVEQLRTFVHWRNTGETTVPKRVNMEARGLFGAVIGQPSVEQLSRKWEMGDSTVSTWGLPSLIFWEDNISNL